MTRLAATVLHALALCVGVLAVPLVWVASRLRAAPSRDDRIAVALERIVEALESWVTRPSA